MQLDPNSVAIAAYDPGQTTGCAAGLFDLKQPTVTACMRRAQFKGNLLSWEIGGTHQSQSSEFCEWFVDWNFSIVVERGLVRWDKFYVVGENFEPRQLNFEKISLEILGGIETLLERANRRIEGFVRYERAEPNQRWNDEEWLKDNDLWVPSKHERDARRHIAGRIDRFLKGEW